MKYKTDSLFGYSKWDAITEAVDLLKKLRRTALRTYSVPKSVKIVGVALAIVATLGVSFASARAERWSSQGAFARQTSTSLNGSGNVFLTANLYGSGGAGTVFLAVADFNGDGKLDYVTAQDGNNTSTLGIAIGNGDGTFKPPSTIAIACGAVWVATGDFNGDGKTDLAVASRDCSPGTNGVSIFLGNGDGTFAAKGTLTSPLSNPASVAAGDFNGDGKLDLAVVDRGASTDAVFFYSGNGDGTFQAPTSVSLGGLAAANQVVVADFNKDGHLDVAVSQINGSNVVVILGNGNGSFQAPRNNALPAQGWSLAVGDLNGDGVPDIVATSPSIGGLTVFLGKGDGNFTPVNNPVSGKPPTANAAVPGGGCTTIAVGDFNKDGKLDIAAGLSGVNSAALVAVLPGNGDGTFGPERLFGTSDTPQSLSVGDFNGDGNLDWIASTGQINSADQGSVTLGLGRGDGTFLASESFVAGQNPAWAAVADFNKDGKLDVVATNSGSGNSSILLGNGDGTFQTATNVSVPGTTPGFVLTGDFNGDGNPDFITFNSPGGFAAPCLGTNLSCMTVFLGKGDGTFQAGTVASTGATNIYSVQTGDFNGDGKLDLALLSSQNQGNTLGISILLGNGDGTFEAPKFTLAAGTRATWMSVGDLNKDGQLDLVVVEYSNNQLQIFLGNGDGTFKAPTTLATGRLPGFSVLGDFNGDGNLDIFVGNQQDVNAEVFLGVGDGTFLSPSIVSVQPTNSPPSIEVVGDFNLDGHLDVLLTHNDNRGSGITLLLGNGDGTFQTAQNYLVSGGSFVTAVGDFNGDGAPDALLVDNGEEFISMLLNQTPPPIAVSPSSLSFGNQLVGSTSAAQMIKVSNNSAKATTVGVALSGSFAQTNACPVSPATLAPATSCTISVTFKPTATGPLNGSVTISDTLPGSPQIVALSGRGVAPIVTLGGNSIAFGSQIVGSSSGSQTVGLTNTGTAALTFTGTGIAISGTNSGDFSQTNNCGASVAAGANCSISVTFKPTATGVRSASVTIADNASGSPQSVTLSGTGTAPAVTFAPMSLNFAGQLVTTASTAQNIMLTNNGTATLNITSVGITGANSSDFSQTNTCGSSVAAGANCAISITFKPTATGNRAASVTIADDATGNPQSVALAGIGMDFSIDVAAGGSSSVTVTGGKTASYNLQVTPVSGFNLAVTISCSGAPSESTCTPSPTSVTPNGNSASPFTLNATTTAPSIFIPRGIPLRFPPIMWVRLLVSLLFALAVMVLLARLAARTRRPNLLLAPAMIVLFGVTALGAGCAGGGGGGGGVHDPGTPAGTYTLTVTGTSNGVSHSLKLTLQVN